MEIGDAVKFEMDDDVFIVGELEQINEDGYAVVREAHAFHRVWGGSNGARGETHTVELDRLEPDKRYKHITKGPLQKWKAKNLTSSQPPQPHPDDNDPED